MPMPRHGFAWHTDGAKAASVPSPFGWYPGLCLSLAEVRD
jgi:hypothetical protein